MDDKISVIIPAYNAEESLERTVKSVLHQTYTALTVWIVDDGSTDGTGNVANRLAAEDRRVTVIHQKNAGAYQARLNALKQITTSYFTFVDADDTVVRDAYDRMVSFAEQEKLDVVQCGYHCGKIDINARSNVACPQVLTSRDEVKRFYVQSRLIDIREGSYIWDKLYRNQYDFSKFDPTDHVTNFDDLIFNLQFFERVERMGFIDEPLYQYSTTIGSAVHSFNENKLKDFREACRVRHEILPRYGADSRCEANLLWFKLNRMNCLKSTLRASNLTVKRKISIGARLIAMKP